ncbi:hypothetical protein LOTGIDRAFT_169698 [Lottia gigantea]|uniref:Peroxin/Ferlin domain-containing protein n=1 Tax=Lottia gigantea TaxID=225164 RepID=V3ZQA6_LOTGI|nr:hypothetical protein LOTGIDRAFT_169698 [Lottia gigantea]ESO83061.1 hypothetical protein LOTGIDRAFT_169698 [Lottia gigantea]
MLFEKDAGHKKFIEDIYECQSRGIPGGNWAQASRPWSDVKGDECPGRDDIKLTEGWKWDNDWQVDLSRAVDKRRVDLKVFFILHRKAGLCSECFYFCQILTIQTTLE